METKTKILDVLTKRIDSPGTGPWTRGHTCCLSSENGCQLVQNEGKSNQRLSLS